MRRLIAIDHGRTNGRHSRGATFNQFNVGLASIKGCVIERQQRHITCGQHLHIVLMTQGWVKGFRTARGQAVKELLVMNHFKVQVRVIVLLQQLQCGLLDALHDG